MPDPERDGNARPWTFPPGAEEQDIRATLDRCPARAIESDVWDLSRAVGLSEGKLSLDEQRSLPAPYLTAWSVMRWEQAEALAVRLREKRRNG